MEKKIIDIKTISTHVLETNPTHPWYPESFESLSNKLLSEGYQPYKEVIVSFEPKAYDGDRFLSGGSKILTQQFVKYEQD